MRIAVIEHLKQTYSNCHRRNRNAEWNWDVTNDYTYSFYCDSPELPQGVYKTIDNFLKALEKCEHETIESDYSDNSERQLYDIENSKKLATMLGYQIFEPGVLPNPIYHHSFYFANVDNGEDKECPNITDFPYGVDWESLADNAQQYDTLPVIKYGKLVTKYLYHYNRHVWMPEGSCTDVMFDLANKLYYIDLNNNEFRTSALLADRIFPSGKYAIVVKDNKWGVIDKEGNLIVNHQCYQITEVHDLFCVIKNNDSSSCINYQGQILMPFTTNKFSIHSDRYAEVIYDNFKLIYDLHSQRLILNASYQSVESFTDNCIIVTGEHGLTDVYNHNSLKLNVEPLKNVIDNNNGLVTGKRPHGWVAFDYTGNVVFDDSENFYTFIEAMDGHIRLLKKKPNNYSEHGLADMNGKIIFPCHSDAVIKLFESGGSYYYILKKYKKERLFNRYGHSLSVEYDFINKENEGICIAFNGDYTIKDGRLKVKKGVFYGITISEQLLFSIECQFLYKFVNGIATFKKDNKFGKINNRGEVIVPPIYEAISVYHQGLSAARLNNKWGYIDINNNIVINFDFDTAEDFDENGEAYVEQKSEYTNSIYATKINTKGESVEEWTCVSDDEDDDEGWSGYSEEELEDMYRAALDGNPSTQWNLD